MNLKDSRFLYGFFFFGPGGEFVEWHLPPTVHTWAENSVRLLLTKNPACSCSYPWCQVHGISFERFPRSDSWPDIALPILLTPAWPFVLNGGSSSEGMPSLVRCTDTSDEQTRPGSEPRPLGYGANPCVPLALESHFEPITHEWLYRIAPKIIETHKPYHDDNVERDTDGRVPVWVSNFNWNQDILN